MFLSWSKLLLATSCDIHVDFLPLLTWALALPACFLLRFFRFSATCEPHLTFLIAGLSSQSMGLDLRLRCGMVLLLLNLDACYLLMTMFRSMLRRLAYAQQAFNDFLIH